MNNEKSRMFFMLCVPLVKQIAVKSLSEEEELTMILFIK